MSQYKDIGQSGFELKIQGFPLDLGQEYLEEMLEKSLMEKKGFRYAGAVEFEIGNDGKPMVAKGDQSDGRVIGTAIVSLAGVNKKEDRDAAIHLVKTFNNHRFENDAVLAVSIVSRSGDDDKSPPIIA